MKVWKKKEIDSNTIEFRKDEVVVKVPKLIGGKYEVFDILSSGGYGAILQAKNIALDNREVLIKTSLYHKVKSNLRYKHDRSRKEAIEEMRLNLRLEYERMIKFRNGGECRMPSVIDVIRDKSPYLYGPHIDKETKEKFYLEEFNKDEVYLVMQKIDGINLGRYLKVGLRNTLRERNYTSVLLWEKDVLEYMKEITSIFARFHKKEYRDENIRDRDYTYFIYQDLKPDNIMLTYDKFITLIDFGGILEVKNENGTIYSNYKNGGIPGCGTDGYWPREMKESPFSLDEKADIYTIGSTMFSLLTCEDPTENSVSAYTQKINTDKLREIGYTEETIELVKNAANLDKEKRHRNVIQLEKNIKRCLGILNSKLNRS